MEIKKFDIVQFEGENYRVRYVDMMDMELHLMSGRWVKISDVTLVESVILPQFKIGDEVIIHPIPYDECLYYPCGWSEEMSSMMGDEPHKILDYDDLDNSYLINDFWFSPYHLEKIDSYDIV